MNESKNGPDGVLFGKYLAGEASPDEVIQLEDWISMSASNKLIFDQFLATWNGIQIKPGYQSPDKAVAWRNIQRTIDGNQEKVGALKKLFVRHPIAAVLMGLAILSIIPLIFFIQTANHEIGRNISISSVNDVRETTLPDGSMVVLNNNSVISYPEKFNPDHRDAELRGEAYFTIIHDPARPFKLRFENVDILVLGTSFNLRRNIEGSVETQVKSGRVKMYNANGEVIISAGQTGIYNKEDNSFFLKQYVDVNAFSYATKNFVFSDEQLSTIIKYLENAYARKIVIKNEQVGKCKMTSSFSNKSIEYILDVISATLNITYTVEKDTIYIGGENEGC